MKPQCDIEMIEHLEFTKKYHHTAAFDEQEEKLASAVLAHFFSTDAGIAFKDEYVWDDWTEKTINAAYGSGPFLSERLQQVVGSLMRAKNPGLTRKPEPVVIERPRDAQGRFIAEEQPQPEFVAPQIPDSLLDFVDAYRLTPAQDVKDAGYHGIVLAGKRYSAEEFETALTEATHAGLI